MKFLNDAYLDSRKIDKKAVVKTLSLKINGNHYHNALPELLIDYDKGYGIARPVPVFNPEDYFVYYYCVKSLESILAVNRVDNTYGGWTLDGHFRSRENAQPIEGEDSPSTGLNPAAGAMAYGEFTYRTKQLLDSTPDDIVILELDVSNFYDSIRIDRLQRLVRAAVGRNKVDVVDLLFYFLANSSKLLHSYRPQTTSIPQDMVGDCSRILANFYLQEYDKKIFNFCKKNNISYLRYADDQLFILPSDFDFSKVCHVASKHLYHLGLNINQKKVKVWNKAAFIDHRCMDIYAILDPSKSNAEQTNEDCDRFVTAALAAIKKHGDKRRVNYSIKNGGLPLVKKVAGLGINRISGDNRKEILKHISTDQYLPYLADYTLTKLFKDMSTEEREDFLRKIDEVVSRHNHTAFLYNVMKFRRSNNLTWKKYAIKLQAATKEWRNL